MPLNAICHMRLADGAPNAETRESFTVLPETWTKLAVEREFASTKQKAPDSDRG
jgi:hypothetical protein